MKFVVPTEDRATWSCHGWTPDLVDKRDKYKIYSITPRGYLKLVLGRHGYFTPRQRSIEFIRGAVERGECFAPLQAWPRKSREDGTLPHEGRNRAYVAMMLGIPHVLVAIWKTKDIKF
jgi:hypothetical protein